MNSIETWLECYFDEIEPKDFYRFIFPEGSFQKKGEYRQGVYNGVIVSIGRPGKTGKAKVKRFTVTDDLEAVDMVGRANDFCIMSPVSYAGKARTADNARFLYAFVVDLDKIRERDGEPIGLINFWNRHIDYIGRIPKPTFIVSSGTGVHVYYVLEEPIALYKNAVKELQRIKRGLTSLLWHDTIVDIKSSKEVQQEGIYQGFRMPGTITKTGGRARAFQTGERISIEELASYVKGLGESHEKYAVKLVKKKKVTLETAKKQFPEWYERRIVRKEPAGVWHTSRAVYEWWLRRVREEAEVGHRYYCVMILAMYARKCSMYDEKHNPNPVTLEELERDAFGLWDVLEAMTESEDNHFTDADILDALEAYNDRWITYPVRAIEYKSGLRMPVTRRNGRKQSAHLAIARIIQTYQKEEEGKDWRQGNGRKAKGDIVAAWIAKNPDGKKADCIRETGLAKSTVYKYWKE